jgi:hypothetical protein
LRLARHTLTRRIREGLVEKNNMGDTGNGPKK